METRTEQKVPRQISTYLAQIGSLGGQARARSLSSTQLSDQGAHAAQTRWVGQKKKAATAVKKKAKARRK